MNLIRLAQYKRLFKDDGSFQEFLQLFQDALRTGSMQMVLSESDEVLFTALSPESTKEVLCNRMLERLGENPALIDDLKDRIVGTPENSH